jgi:F0F1-type ATP synthase membrane subunit c/vacuolar-type H+-ATPase subunit K
VNKKIIVWVGIGCGVVCLALAIIVLISGGLFVNGLLEKPENVDIDTTVPINVIEGESFVIEVRVHNLAEQSQLLDSIDISSDYLAGIAIEKTEPEFIESFQIPLIQYQSYEFKRNIPAGDTQVVRFFAVGLHPADFAGDIDVCINSGSLCSSFIARTVIEE